MGVGEGGAGPPQRALWMWAASPRGRRSWGRGRPFLPLSVAFLVKCRSNAPLGTEEPSGSGGQRPWEPLHAFRSMPGREGCDSWQILSQTRPLETAGHKMGLEEAPEFLSWYSQILLLLPANIAEAGSSPPGSPRAAEGRSRRLGS